MTELTGYHDPISVKITYIDADGSLVEKQFRSLNQAAKHISISPQTLKELSHGEKPKLRDSIPTNLTVVRIPTLPKPPKIPKPPKQKKLPSDEKWHCDVCQTDIKIKSKYAHILTNKHRTITDALKKKL